MMSTIGSRIRSLRLELGMNQVDFSKKINVSKQTLFKYENGIVSNIPSDKIEEIAKACNTSPAYIMGWDVEMHNETQQKYQQQLRVIKYATSIDPSLLDRMLAAGGRLPKENLECFVLAMEAAVKACESARKEKPQD